ncbi:MAG: VWA domain-containing protein [Actinomycetota bacterium]
MTFANPAGLWLLTAAIGVIALHLLKPRRADTVVSSGLLWETETVGATAARPWQRLTPTVGLLLQLLAVVAAALALANPVIRAEAELADHTVVVIDTSASMGALDGDPDRLTEAKAVALGLWDELPDGGTASVVVAGPTPRVAVTATGDRERFAAALAAVELSDGPADLSGAMALADGLETVDQTIGIILVSDGQHDDDALRSLPPGVTHRLVGTDDVNRAIRSLAAVPADDGLRVTAVLQATGGPDVTVPLRFDVDGATRLVQDVELTGEDPVTVEVDLPAGDRVIARLGGEDLLAIDDTAYALARRPRAVAVAVEGTSDPFVEALVASLPGVTVVDPAVDPPDVSIFVGEDVPADIVHPFWAIAPPSGFAGVEPAGTVEGPVPTLIEAGDRLLTGLDLSRLRLTEAQRLDAPTADVLVGAEGAPLIVRGRRSGLPFVYFGFELGNSSLPLDVGFPVLGDRIIQELAGSGLVPTSLRVGQELSPPAGRNAVVTNPRGNELFLAAGLGSTTLDRPGFWTVTADGGPPIPVAVSLPAAESELTPLPVSPSDPRELRPNEEPPTTERSWRWVALLVLAALIAVEWWYWLPRAGVPRWQRRTANGLRVTALAAIALAMVGFSIPIPTSEVATVFVVDRSDSIGPDGRRTADRFVEDAIEARADENDIARSAVVISADGSRVDQLLRDRERPNTVSVVEIDQDRTDLASGLRLAGAMLPEDSKRRIVVLSDGRVTSGNAVAEAASLAERGVAIDYVLLDDRGQVDASVASVRAPSSVDEGETVTIEASVFSTVAQPGLVTLRRNGEVVGTTEVALAEGSTTVTLRDTPPVGGLVSYDVSVSVALDDQSRNDVGRASVQVQGPARVLVVAGGGGDGPDPAEALVAALESSSIIVDRVTPGGLPELERLAGYQSVVLVDVPADDLTERQMLDLAANTRDLGRGLVTIGGPKSYGMGGYKDSTLESVLPVVSDILDPRRRRTVAQVFAIDTSESMGNCHCAENGDPTQRLEGGVNKTDIARAGAARAIDALGPQDEVGILGIDTQTKWLLDLQQVPADEIVEAGLARVTPAGNTDLRATLIDAAEQLRVSDAGLKHIILFSDGFTPLGSIDDLRKDAAALQDEGITVSVVGTGEGSTAELRSIADAGGGRFYPGRDLARIPEILVQESVIASRSFINEGEFLPTVTGSSPITDPIEATPQLFGFVATTAKPTARTLLTIGEEQDPLLASWQTGLGRATSWTSDAQLRWAQAWADWDGYVPFWSRLVRDSFPLDSGGAVRATIEGDQLRVRAELGRAGADDGAEGAAAVPTGPVTVTVTDPDGVQREVELTRTGDGVFEGTTTVGPAGSYAVGAGGAGEGGFVIVGSGMAPRSYAAEYLPGAPNEALLASLAETTGGRAGITPAMAFDGEDLPSSSRSLPLSGWLLLIAIGTWLAALVFSRLWIAGTVPSPVGRSRATVGGDGRPRRWPRRRGRGDDADGGPPDGSDGEPPAGPPAPPPDPDAAPPPVSSVDQLLKAKRDRR